MGGLLRTVAVVVLILLAGCESTPSMPSDGGISTAVSDYRLGSGDQIRLNVFNQPNLSGDFWVDSTGTISLPLVGPIAAGGKTTAELENAIADKLRGTYLVDPQVSIQVIQFRPFYILGEVNKPGEYPSIAGLTVLNAVATAGGFTYRANRHRVYIRHANESTEKPYKLTGDTPVHPGDTIRVPERFF